MKLEEIRKNIYHLRFESQYLATATFMRLQEFYESSIKGIRGHYFTVEEYMDRYAKTYGNFTYNIDWGGFNVPDFVVRKFFDLFSYDLTKKENELKNEISILLNKKDRFYLIGTYDNDDVAHEVAHGYYYLDNNYKKQMDSLSKATIYRVSFLKGLTGRGYTKEVLLDEMQAYLSTSSIKYLIEEFGYKREWGKPEEFKMVFLKKDSSMK